MREALALLDEQIPASARLVVGDDAAMILAYGFTFAVLDVDAFAAQGGLSLAELDSVSKDVAKQLDIEPDWLNSHFFTFTYVLPQDYPTRLRSILEGNRLSVDALGAEDLLIMKCFAARDKDRPHAIHLIKRCTDLSIVDKQITLLSDKGIPGADKAADYFDDLREELDV